MIGNLSKVDQRLKTYFAVPDKAFEVKSGLSPQEEAVKQRVRQYWADKSIPESKKLEGLNIDLSGFDPRNTSNRQLLEVGTLLAEQGLIDTDLVRSLSNLNAKFDASGENISMDTALNAYDYLTSQFERLTDSVYKGNETAEGELIEINASLSVLMALEKYAKAPRERSLVNIRV
jgi:hypothetical protein